MLFLPPEDEIELYTTGFDNDIFGRKKVSVRLSNILDRIDDPLVIALDGRWGTGKTYFLKRWVGAHGIENGGKAHTIYFDAFAHDYLGDPLIALVSALVERTPADDKSKIDRVKETAIKLAKPVARIGLAIATFGATEALNDFGDVVVKSGTSEVQKKIDEFWKKEEGRQAAFKEFCDAITKLTLSDDGKTITPIAIVIDELDRCRPDYALEVLEIIKHFFAVPHVHFILGVNLSALENSVRARYGLEIDATAYLQKFLSFTINLPNHIGDYNRTLTTMKYVETLAKKMGTPQHIVSEIEKQLKFITLKNHVSIRDVGKILSTASLLADVALNKDILSRFRILMVTLIIVSVVNPSMLKRFVAANIDNNELRSFFSVEDKNLNQKLESGEYNRDFDHHLLVTYSTWLWIIGDETLRASDFGRQIAQQFSHFGETNGIERHPQYIYDNWLNNLNFDS